MKVELKQKRREARQIRESFKTYYINKFYNKWMNKFKFNGLNYQQIEFIMRKFWDVGAVAVLKPVGIPEGINLEENEIIFTTFAPQSLFNIYDYPSEVMPINTRGVPFIPSKSLKLDEEIVIIYCQKNHKSIYSSIECKIKQLVDLEMTIRTNTKTQKFPWVVAVSPENKTAINDMIENIENDEAVLLTTLEEPQKAKALVSGAPYVLDKLEQLRQKLEDDIDTILGCNNVGIAEKKEHLTVGEVNANNQSIQESNDQYLEMIQEGFARELLVLGHEVDVELKNQVVMMDYPEESEDQEDVE